LVRTKNLRKAKIKVWQLLPPESDNVAGFRPNSSESGQIRPNQWPDPVKPSQIPAILAKSGGLLTMAGFRWPNVAGF
jgi:hypothetical protein